MRTVLAPSSAITNILRRRFSSAVFTRSSSAEPAPADSLEFEKSSDSATESLAGTSVGAVAASETCSRSAERAEVDEAAFDDRLEELGSALPALEGELERAGGGVPECSESSSVAIRSTR